MSAGDICEIFKSSKGRDILFKDGYSYNWKRTTKDKFSWVCECYNKFRCRAIAKTVLQENGHMLVDNMCLHSHEPQPTRKAVAVIKQKLQQSSRNSNDRPCALIQNAIAAVPAAQSMDLPSRHALRQLIKRTRRDENIPSQPAAVDDLEIPNK